MANDLDFKKYLWTNGLESAFVERFEADQLGEEWDTVIRPEEA